MLPPIFIEKPKHFLGKKKCSVGQPTKALESFYWPLRNVKGQEPAELEKMFEPKFHITHRITTDLTLIERARGFLEAAALSEEWVREMGHRALILEAHHTTHIEGTRLTLEQSKRLMEGKPVPEADPEDTRELLNYRSAFDFVSEYPI
jgi:hypothetical protein